MSRSRLGLFGILLGIFFLGGIAGFLIFWQGAKHGMLWATPDVGWVIGQDMSNGKWDQAVKLALGRIRDENKDSGEYFEVSTIYLARAEEDSARRDEWISKAISYADRAISLGSNDIVDLLGAARTYERAGDLAKNGCPYYQKALTASERGLSLMPKDFIRADGRQFPAQPLRTEFDGLVHRLQTKTSSCSPITSNAPSR